MVTRTTWCLTANPCACTKRSTKRKCQTSYSQSKTLDTAAFRSLTTQEVMMQSGRSCGRTRSFNTASEVRNTRDDRSLSLTVDENGRGFNPEAAAALEARRSWN